MDSSAVANNGINRIDDDNDQFKWDLVVLTARNAEQKELFELELTRLCLEQKKLCAQTMVLEDTPPGAKIGSGGATLNALLFLFNSLGGESFFSRKRVLLLHSGGLSQRLFHVALTGKAFMLMPSGRTLLEHKLISYQPLLRAVVPSQTSRGGFVFVASADVLEYFPADFSLSSGQAEAQLLLIAHQSTLEVAEQHGVYLLGKESDVAKGNITPKGTATEPQSLKLVLQKPQREVIRRVGAVLPHKSDFGEELALTDSCYLINYDLAIEMVQLRKEMDDAQLAEVCCYRDFLGPLGYASDIERKIHFRPEESALHKWQIAIWDLMHCKKSQVVDLGQQSFFHFGTPNELLAHFFGTQSVFRDKFLPTNEIGNVLYSEVGPTREISDKSLVEWCKLSGNCAVGKGCILSGLVYEGAEPIRIGDGVCASAFPIEQNGADKGYVTVAFHRDDDLKATDSLQWFGHKVGISKCSPRSLWGMPLFSVHPTPNESLRATLGSVAAAKLQNGKAAEEQSISCPKRTLLSISQVLKSSNAKKVLNWRKSLIK